MSELNALIAALESEGLEQLEAILTLANLGTMAMPAVPALKKLLGADSTISTTASDAIYKISCDPADAIEVGLGLLGHPDWLQRVVGIEHLMGLGPKAASTITHLEWVEVDDVDEIVRKRAREALEGIEACFRPQKPDDLC